MNLSKQGHMLMNIMATADSPESRSRAMREVTAYQCDSCGKVLKYKSSSVRHEKNCKHNIFVRACTTCRYQDREVIGGGGWDEPPYEMVIAVCNSPDAAEDEDFTFEDNGNPHFIMRHCKYWEQKNEPATN